MLGMYHLSEPQPAKVQVSLFINAFWSILCKLACQCSRGINQIFLDLSKTFDTGNHRILCKNRTTMALEVLLCMYRLRSLLGNRANFVEFNQRRSCSLDLKIDAPQGSTQVHLYSYVN